MPQSNGLGRTLLRAVETALSRVGVRAAAMPAIISAADEAHVPSVPAPPSQPAMSAGTAANDHLDLNGVLHALGEAPAAPSVVAGIGSPAALQTPPALCTYSWGSRVRSKILRRQSSLTARS